MQLFIKFQTKVTILDQTHLSVKRTFPLQNYERHYNNITGIFWSIQRFLFDFSDLIYFPAKENPVIQAEPWAVFLSEV